MKQRLLSLLAFLSFFASCGTPANANLTIDPTYLSSITSDSNAATIESTINTAISNIEGDISNNVTVYIDFGEMNGGLGESETYQYTLSYSYYLNDLETNQTLSAADTTALASLGVTGPSGPYPTDNPVNGGTDIQSTAGVFRALGFTVPSGNPDGIILFNNSIVDESLGTPTGADGRYYSLESVVAHEIDEVLGAGGGGSQLNAVQQDITSPTGAVGPLDLFRYSASGVRSYTTSGSATSYFSINGGVTNLDYFNQNSGGDYADWGTNPTVQVQDAYATPDTSPQLGSSEITALDVIGWNLTPAGLALAGESVPEPSCVYLLLGGVIALGIHRRRGKSA